MLFFLRYVYIFLELLCYYDICIVLIYLLLTNLILYCSACFICCSLFNIYNLYEYCGFCLFFFSSVFLSVYLFIFALVLAFKFFYKQNICRWINYNFAQINYIFILLLYIHNYITYCTINNTEHAQTVLIYFIVHHSKDEVPRFTFLLVFKYSLTKGIT